MASVVVGMFIVVVVVAVVAVVAVAVVIAVPPVAAVAVAVVYVVVVALCLDLMARSSADTTRAIPSSAPDGSGVQKPPAQTKT